MFDGARKVSVIVAPHGSTRSWTRVLPVPALIGLVVGVATLLILLLVLSLQVADLSARAREVRVLRTENEDLRRQVGRVEELQTELSRLREFETRIRRWAGISSVDTPMMLGDAGELDWAQDDARLAEIPSLTPIEGWVSRPFDSTPEGHVGLDLVQETGTPVRAAALGLVRFAGWDETYGNLVILDHGNGFTTLYGHNDSLNVADGDLVARGDTVAQLGNTGRSSAPHLHFEVRLEEQPLDPAYLLSKS
ncbi:MAG: peptidoglycan DD-metalloendopeptidase family protein [bacterium]